MNNIEKVHRYSIYSVVFLLVVCVLGWFLVKPFYPLTMVYQKTFDFVTSCFWVYGGLSFVVWFFILRSMWNDSADRENFGLLMGALCHSLIIPPLFAYTFSDGVTRFYIAMTASEPFSEELHCYGGGSNKVLGLYQYVEDQKRERFKQFGVADWCQRADSPSHGGRYIRIDGFKNHLGRLITKVSFLPDDPNSALFHGQEMALVDYFVHVGVAEELRVVKDLDVKGPIGQRLALGYKVGTFRLFAGLHITDLGPVMILVDDENGRGYYPISEQQIAAYQRDGLLPSPLPTLEYTWQDYFFGYLGWPILLFILVFRTLDRRSQLRQKLDKQAAEAELLASI